MIKKFALFVGLLWLAFLAFLVFQDDISGFLNPDNQPPKLVQEPIPVTPEPIRPIPVPSPKPSNQESIPFAPLPEIPAEKMVVTREKVEPKPASEEQKLDNASAASATSVKQDIFGLICTKFERVPSRFRLVAWDGTKKIQLEDISKSNASSQKHPKFWIRLRIPYKEFIHSSSKESFFKPTAMNDPNKRLIAHSFEIKKEALSYSGITKPIGYLILKDFKIGGPPYQLTSEMDLPLTSSYFLHFEQMMGPQKFFHDLTGKQKRHKFGGWGFEYQVTNQNFAQNKITVLRKEIKTGSLISKELQGPSSL